MKIRSIIYFAVSLFVILASCKKNSVPVPYTPVSDSALLKINYTSLYKANPNPSVQLEVNGQRVSSLLTYGTSTYTSYPYPGGGLNTGGGSTPDYFSVAPGSNKISVAIPKVGTSIDSVVLYSTNITLAGGNYYTLHIADTAANMQSVLITEDVAAPDSGFSKYRFVNLMPDQTALDLYFGTTKVASNIPYKGSSPVFTLTQANAYQWAIRPAGAASTSTALVTYPTGSSLHTVPNQRVFTVYARGYSSVTSSTDPRRGQISLFYNR